MKLRVKNNSIRLRLTQSEVARLGDAGRVEETIEFGLEPRQQLVYTLEITTAEKNVYAAIENNRVTIFVPKTQADEWIKSEQVSIKIDQSIGGGKILSLLVEKDFACLEPRATEGDSDSFIR